LKSFQLIFFVFHLIIISSKDHLKLVRHLIFFKVLLTFFQLIVLLLLKFFSNQLDQIIILLFEHFIKFLNRYRLWKEDIHITLYIILLLMTKYLRIYHSLILILLEQYKKDFLLLFLILQYDQFSDLNTFLKFQNQSFLM